MNTVGLIIYPAADVPKTTKFFATLLGTDPYVESPYYTGFKPGDLEIGIIPQAATSVSGALAYVDVSDIKAALAALLAQGAETLQDITDVANGLLVASVKDLNGSPIGLRQKPNA